jgi:alpha-glucosidase
MRWLPAPDGVLAFARGESFVAVTNVSDVGLALPTGAELLLASADLDEGSLPPDASAWLRIDPETLARSPGWPTREAE